MPLRFRLSLTVLLPMVLPLLSSAAFAIVDTDSDGISKVWTRYYGAEGLTPANDDDHDGWSNHNENIAGTDPLDPASVPAITRIERIQDGVLLRWPAIAGMDYRIESSTASLDGAWSTVRTMTAGISGSMVAVIPRPANPSAFFRVAANTTPLGAPGFSASLKDDSDGDGLSDLVEFMAGTDPFDSTSKLTITEFKIGSGLRVDFNSVPGKRYQLQGFRNVAGGAWQNEGPSIIANGIVTSMTLENQDSTLLMRLSVSDVDSDSDGASDWEERVTGLDPLRDRTKGGANSDVQTIQELLLAPVRYILRARRPTAIYGREEPGMFELRRSSGFGAAKVALLTAGTAVPGTDISPLPTTVAIPTGEDQLFLPVTALQGATAGRFVWLNLADHSLADDDNELAAVRIVTPAALTVTDFGATGDGVTDDTAAIQAAIHALEGNLQANTLYFPSGTYRLNSHFASNETISGKRRILKLGTTDLSGRDLIFLGEEGSVLKSTVSPQRAHMLVAMASFRSLEFRGMTFEKNDVPLANGDPQGADGVSVVRIGRKKVNAIAFDDCIFRNCHGSVMVYGNGYDVRGYLKNLSFVRCQILNPYGANTTNVIHYWGGGQQVGMGAWVQTASYRNCLFEGAGSDMTDHTTCPAGRLKDGCHFGSPLRLEFRNNVVRRMGVESVYQLNRRNYMGTTASGFIMPPADGTTPVTIITRPEETTYISGQVLNIRTPTAQTTEGKNNILRLLGWDAATNTLTLVNDGNPGNSQAGSSIPYDLPIYLQTNQSGVVDIRDNIIDGTRPEGAEMSDPTGIVSDTKGLVKDNFIVACASGVLNYVESAVPIYPGTQGLIVQDNFIKVRHPDESPGPVSYGIQTHANEITIARNLIACPVSRRSVGVALRGKDARVFENRIIALEPMVNGYFSDQRAVGILVGNTSYGTSIAGNTTQNFDVGVGPEPNQWIIHSVTGHTSLNDVLAIDPVGLVDP